MYILGGQYIAFHLRAHCLIYYSAARLAFQLLYIALQLAQQARYCSVTLNCNKTQIQLRAIHRAGQCYLLQVDTNGIVIAAATGDFNNIGYYSNAFEINDNKDVWSKHVQPCAI